MWANDELAAQASFLEATAAGWEQGERFEYAIEDRERNLLGSVGLMRRVGPGGLEIGYWVHSGHTRRGIAKLAAAALTDAAFGLPWVDHVEIHHDKENLASGAVPAGLGFQMVRRSTSRLWRMPTRAGISSGDSPARSTPRARPTETRVRCWSRKRADIAMGPGPQSPRVA